MLPPVKTWAAYRDLWRQTGPWEPALRTICEAAGLERDGFQRAPSDGTHVVWTKAGELVIKLHCPFFPDAEVEQSVTRFMSGKLPVPTPELVATGDVAGWPYTVTTWVPGAGLDEVWPSLDLWQRSRIARQLGEVVRAWHDASSSGLPIPNTGWAGFIDSRVAATQSLQQASGLGERLIEQVSEFLAPFLDEFRSPIRPTLLHSDFKREHIRVDETRGDWNICGVIDFGDAMVGHHEYDFFDSTLSLVPPDRTVLRAFFDGYGEGERYVSVEGQQRLLAWALVHNDTGVTAFRPQKSRPSSVVSLADLAAQLWPLV